VVHERIAEIVLAIAIGFALWVLALGVAQIVVSAL
jgi:hypothetical protein